MLVAIGSVLSLLKQTDATTSALVYFASACAALVVAMAGYLLMVRHPFVRYFALCLLCACCVADSLMDCKLKIETVILLYIVSTKQ